jgi:hypothetical protein
VRKIIPAWVAGASFVLLLTNTDPALGQAKPDKGTAPSGPAATVRDGQHDFDFAQGTWHTHIRRMSDPLGGTGAFVEMDGTVSVQPVWGGRAWLEQIEADGPAGHWQALILFLYNPQARQWNDYYINSAIGTLGQPLVGAFKDGRGELLSGDTYQSRAILVRGLWLNITADAHAYEEDYSDDGGTSWKRAFFANLKRIPASEAKQAQPVSNEFSFDLGNWHSHSSRLEKPLTGSSTWTELEGTTAVKSIWGGRANLAEVHTMSPSGPIDFLALRWYNPAARQWFLDFANVKGGELGVPMAGTFNNGRVDFYDEEPIDGKAILVRFSLWHDEKKDQAESEQAFSADGGRSWEVNFRTSYWRTKSD